jgi:RimJ/RimL family protein N-acetyltransferase
MILTDATHRRIEIGFTWIVPRLRRTRVNTEAKLLQLTHAFESLGAVRVEFKTDARNERSRSALLRIGAKEEGTLRSHMLCWDGHRRDSVYFSILDTEWPDVKARLSRKLEATT